MNNLKTESSKKDEQIIGLTNEMQQLKAEISQCKGGGSKQNIETKLENQNTEIQRQTEEKEEETRKEQDIARFCFNKNYKNMLTFVNSSDLKNGVDFLLLIENDKEIELKNKEWHNYKFGTYLLGENIYLNLDCDRTVGKEELGHLRIRTSHLWIKYPSSKIDCSRLGYPPDQGPGKGEVGKRKSGGGYATKGEEGCYIQGDGKAGGIYGEETLLKEIHFGSGGGGFNGGSGGGIIELVIEQQLINNGSIESNGGGGWGGGGGSGGSILIELQSHSNTLEQKFGVITCIGGRQNYFNEGGNGRIAIYGIELSSKDMKNITPKPFNRLHK
ncbi:hypothetical protein RFI_32760 [Reticulomyxa filosa]|uniref:Uncharacterized protein n=1 Tax=Reticulomyxa filosa TaxID=46433 RepID=X6LV80_RETFI|nr:hypothetical protein RFI_32760 [Reticulomyxa filosa]|eukprot:ETO04635.1 hypothetical protein RFI_32760 [Reticulomyxa filosa]